MADINRDENVTATKANFNIGGIIAAIALLLLVIGLLKYFGVSPF